jgi:drug/metabolite transporter (DMT)-like permease
VLGVLWLGEPLTLQLVLALAGVAVGIVLVNRKAVA